MTDRISLPTITVSDLSQRAQEYAEVMVRELERFNQEHPFPAGWTEEDEATFKTISSEWPAPTTEKLKTRFAELFCLSMSNHYVIVPDPIPNSD